MKESLVIAKPDATNMRWGIIFETLHRLASPDTLNRINWERFYKEYILPYTTGIKKMSHQAQLVQFAAEQIVQCTAQEIFTPKQSEFAPIQEQIQNTATNTLPLQDYVLTLTELGRTRIHRLSAKPGEPGDPITQIGGLITYMKKPILIETDTRTRLRGSGTGIERLWEQNRMYHVRQAISQAIDVEPEDIFHVVASWPKWIEKETSENQAFIETGGLLVRLPFRDYQELEEIVDTNILKTFMSKLKKVDS